MRKPRTPRNKSGSRFDGNTEQYLKTLHDQKFTQQQFQEKIAARLKQTEQLYRRPPRRQSRPTKT